MTQCVREVFNFILWIRQCIHPSVKSKVAPAAQAKHELKSLNRIKARVNGIITRRVLTVLAISLMIVSISLLVQHTQIKKICWECWKSSMACTGRTSSASHVANSLSCFQMDRFRNLAPHANLVANNIPA